MTPFYSKNGITIYCGDCLEIMPKLDLTFDMILADLPYGKTLADWDSIIPIDTLWEQYEKIGKKGTSVVLTGAQPFSSLLVISKLEWFKHELIWDKVLPVGFQIAQHRPMMRHENVLIFGIKGKLTYTPKKKKKKTRRSKKNYGNSKVYPLAYMDNKERIYDYSLPVSILKYTNANQKLKKHQNQKPLGLFEYLIELYSIADSIILDNTMGSGTTLVAAKNLGRNAVGIEISEEYCKIAVQRLEGGIVEGFETEEQLKKGYLKRNLF